MRQVLCFFQAFRQEIEELLPRAQEEAWGKFWRQRYRRYGEIEQNERMGVAMLEGNRYWDEKRIYNERLDEYVNRRGAKYNEALIASVQLLDTTAQETRKTIQRNSAIIAAVVVIWLLVAIFLELQILSWIIKPIRELRATALAIAGGNEKQRVAVHSRDEIGELGMAFNTMADKLQESKRNVEEKVENRTRKIEEINKYMVERELKMIELKSRLQKAEEAAKTPRS